MPDPIASSDPVIDLTDTSPTDRCLRLLADHIPLSLLMDLALPCTDELYELMSSEQADTSWIPAPAP